MQQTTDACLAEARAELLRDRATFEERVRSVLEQLTREKLHLAAEWRRLLAGRQRLVVVGRRLRQRWRQQNQETSRALDRSEASLARKLRVVERVEIKTQGERAKLSALRMAIRRDAKLLKLERAELIAYRSRFEAERRGWQEEQQRRLNEERELDRRVMGLRRELEELEARTNQNPRRNGFGDAGLQRVA